MTEELKSNNHHAPQKNCKKSITNLQFYKASGVQSTNLFRLKNDHNLQVFTKFHLNIFQCGDGLPPGPHGQARGRGSDRADRGSGLPRRARQDRAQVNQHKR